MSAPDDLRLLQFCTRDLDGAPRKLFHLSRAREIKKLAPRASAADPRRFLSAEMSARGLTISALGLRMDGDPLINRVLIRAYLEHPSGDVGLGPAIADRLGRALGLSGQFFLDLERSHHHQPTEAHDARQ